MSFTFWRGHDITFGGNNSVNATKEWIIYSYSTSSQIGRVYCNGDKAGWLPDVPAVYDPLRVDSDRGSDDAGCGENGAECRTIAFAVTQWVSHRHTGVVVCSEVSVEKAVSISGLEICISKDAAMEHGTIRSDVESGSLFSVGSGKLELEGWTVIHDTGNSRGSSLFAVDGYEGLAHVKNCTIQADSVDLSFHEPLFVAGRGEIAIEDCQVENVCLEGCSLLMWSAGGSVCVRGGNITQITRRNGNGAVAEKALEAGEMFEFGNVTMNGCRCSAGDGGAIWVEMVGGSCARIGSESSVTGMKQCWAERSGEGGFAGESRGGGICLVLKDGGEDFCVARPLFEENNADWGRNVFVKSPDLKKSTVQAHFPFYPEYFSEQEMQGEDGRTPNIGIPLVYFLQLREVRVSVGDGGVDVSACGFAKYQCKTMDYAFGQQEGMHLVLYNKSYTWRECLVLDGAEGYDLSGKEGMSEVRMVGNESGLYEMVKVGSSVQISLVAFALEPGLKQSQTCVFEVEGEGNGALTLSSSRVSGDADVLSVPFCFVCVRKGKMLMSSVVVEHLCFLVEPFVRCSGTESEAVMMQATFADTTSGGEEGLIVLRDGSTAKISKSAFESSSGSKQPMIVVNKARKTNVSETSVDCSLSGQGDGCFLRGTLGVGCEMAVDGGNMSGTCPRGNGGMLRLVLEGGSKLQIGRSMETIVSKCKAVFAAGSGGCGGGMYLETNSSDVELGLNAVKFDGCQADRHGHNLFLTAPNFTASVTKATLGFVADTTNEEELEGYEGGNSTYAIPLVLYLRDDPEPVMVGGDNKKDFDRCGYAGHGCETMDFVMARWVEENGLNASISNTVPLYSEASLVSGVFVLNGTSVYSQIDVYENAAKKQDGMIETSCATTFTGLKITGPASLNTRFYLICTKSGVLTLSSCALSVRSSLTAAYSMIACTGGQTTLNDVTIRNAVCACGAMIWITGEGSCTMDECTMMNAKGSEATDGCVVYASSGTLEIGNTTFSEEGADDRSGSARLADKLGKWMGVRNCTFRGLSRNGEKGCVLFGMLDEGMVLELNDVNMENCTVSGGSGGGCFVELSKTARLRVGESGNRMLAEGCRALAGEDGGLKGFGGGMLVKCIEEASDMIIAGVKFGEGEKANMADKGGNNVFVSFEESPRLWDLMGMENGARENPIPLVVFFRESAGNVFVGDKGCDYVLCGFEDYPCRGIVHAAALRKGSENVVVTLLADFGFCDSIILDAQEMTINTQGNSHERMVHGEGEGESNWLIETKKNITFEDVSFGMPPSFNCQRESFLKCRKDKLELRRCLAKVDADSRRIDYSFVSVEGGMLVMDDFSAMELCAVQHGLVDGRGLDSKVELSGVKFEGVSVEGERGVVCGQSCGLLSMNDSWMNSSALGDSCLVWFCGCESVNMKGLSIWNVSRTAGSGGAFSGEIGEGCKCEIRGSTFGNVSCGEHAGRGGCGAVEVMRNGKLIIEGCVFEKNGVDEEAGFGGGLFVQFVDVSAKYSMKHNTFAENKASVGKDVYVICPQARKMLYQELWEGTVEEDDEKERFWVYDESSGVVINTSILVMLFPAGEEIVFVDGTVINSEGCGHEETPCGDVLHGFKAMNENQTTIRIVSGTFLGSVIDRDSSLAIEGAKAIHPELEIKQSGQLCVSHDNISLTLRGLTFRFATELSPALTSSQLSSASSSALSSVFAISCGRCAVTDCAFGRGGEGEGDEDQSEVTRWLVYETGGAVEMSSVRFESVDFCNECGIGLCLGGEMVCQNVTISHIATDGPNIFESRGNALVEFSMMNVSHARAEKGRFVTVKEGSSLMMGEECALEGCGRSSVNGSFACCEMSKEAELKIESGAMSHWACDNEKGYGGCLFVKLCAGFGGDFYFKNIQLSENDAFGGKDMFVECVELNASVTQERFRFELASGSDGKAADLKGIDAMRFPSPVDLRLFLIQAHCMQAVVSSEGYDTLGCGVLMHPCQSFWRGYCNTQADADPKELAIQEGATVSRGYDMSSFVVASLPAEEYSKLHISHDIQDGISGAVFWNAKALLFRTIIFSFPPTASSAVRSMIASSSASSLLSIINCSISKASDAAVQYVAVSVTGGELVIESSSYTSSGEYASAPFSVRGTMCAINSSFSTAQTRSSKEGGLMQIKTSGGDSVKMEGCTLEGVDFAANHAQIGEHMFVACKDLNATVTKSSFMFSLDFVKEDDNGLMGSDAVHNETTLLRFLVQYKGSTVHIARAGYDLLRCGGAEDPCRSWTHGVKQFESESPTKIVVIDGGCNYKENGVLSDYEVKSIGEEEEEQSRAELCVVQGDDEQHDVCMRNARVLCFEKISFVVAEGFSNEENGVIVSEDGNLRLTSCEAWMNGRALLENSASFVVVLRGAVLLEGMTVSRSSFGRSLMEIASHVDCVLDSVSAELINVEEGCIISMRDDDSEQMNSKNAGAGISLNKCSFKNITNNGESGSVVVVGGRGSGSKLCINSSMLEMCTSSNSQKGGAILFRLSSGGCLDVRGSTIGLCSCSAQNGCGGGFYVEAVHAGSLNMLFANIKFDSNIAHIGRDLFVECNNIREQINETQFQFDLRESKYNSLNAIFGIDRAELCVEAVNLIEFIVIYQNDTIFTSSDDGSASEDSKNCGTQALPCLSVGYAVDHLTYDFESQIVVVGEGLIGKEVDVANVSIRSRGSETALLRIGLQLECTRQYVVLCSEAVFFRGISFVVCAESMHGHGCFVECSRGTTQMTRCSFRNDAEMGNSTKINAILVQVEARGCLQLENTTLRQISSECPLIACEGQSTLRCTSLIMESLFCACDAILVKECELLGMEKVECHDVVCSSGALFAFQGINAGERSGNSEEYSLSMGSFKNISVEARKQTLFCFTRLTNLRMRNITFSRCSALVQNGMLLSSDRCHETEIEYCRFSEKGMDDIVESKTPRSEICKWNGSLVALQQSETIIRGTTISESPIGGLFVSGGNVMIDQGEFRDNNAKVKGYPSARKNIACADRGMLSIASLKGGDGMLPSTSMWIANSNCVLGGIASERASSFFIPVLESVKMEKGEITTELTFIGKLLLPCNLTVQIAFSIGSESQIEKQNMNESNYKSETEIHSWISSTKINGVSEEVEVSVCILFGDESIRRPTDSFILKNRSEPKSNGDERIVEGGNKEKSIWPIVVVILAIILLFVIIVSVVFAVRWRKQKRRTKELEVIVEDTVKKDPKAFEMVTMEMSPEEQWRRAEREAEKKNEERIKKRVYEKSLGHSESSEHLLSESGSTEYILGRDSDKIPQWMLEKVDEEETRKRTPSPSISSTSTTDTSDTESTFVRGEDLCPTTSSMSNLVDAMACSSPHEKLIVDLRDSLFMLLHGRNEKKEMAIGTLQEREVSAAQILFWVANLALHSFDEMNNPLSSLANLSPHIVLFSEHMVICIALHSDCSSGSDTSSTFSSTSTIVTSSSDCSAINKKGQGSPPPPSSAFEDEDDNRKECLRWKAPELLMNKDLGATKKTVVFSIGMMLWESLTLEIPFGEYEAEVAGMWLKEGKRPKTGGLEGSRLEGLVKGCFSQEARDRCTLTDVKRVLIGLFPAGTVMLTVTDAIGLEEGSGSYRKYSRFSGEGSN
ncbi:uncharacterized protein MONOS_16656 [Monocercomonoides exilis]|uniref:uncharacterized protein n=1 Tax=Monocercomonoides exilis TaxID=2049356 RepID=UPI00355A112D|nr:hypothetical protein MONOS_16656 [Monocercomonoides exilis]